MRSAAAFALVILLSPFAFSQAADSNPSGAAPSVDAAPPAPQTQAPAAQTPQPPNYSNFSIMLVNPAGGAVVLMHNPKNALEYVDVAKTKEAFAAGYVPARAAEFAEILTAIKEEIVQLKAENARLQQQQARQVNSQGPSLLSPADQEAQRRAQAASEKAARRQQLIQSWLMLQNMNRPQTQNFNVNFTDCTKFPALCVGR